tara:strand:+ start:17707 stop:19752 length:2046 start_codon:yes stop_codon:yes gene_type:complete
MSLGFARWCCLLLIATPLATTRLRAETYKRLPPAGIKIDAAAGKSLRVRVKQIQSKLDEAASRSDDAAKWSPDVQVLVRAVRLALDQELFFKKEQVKDAGLLLDEADRRLSAAVNGQRGLKLIGLADQPLQEPQLLVGGFVSHLDDSVQPYGLVIPPNFDAAATPTSRMDVWLHGRGDTKTEIPFLRERMTKVGHYAPESTIVLHPFGRHCNAFKFAGERDVYESIDHVKRLIAIDDDRVAIRGFSMGGAGCWHLAVHDPAMWFAVNPGAGFVDTLVYQKWHDDPPFPLDPVQQKLLRWYDVLPWVTNLKNTQVVAYSGEIDKQKQAADRVFEASKSAGFDWPYVIGAGMAHKIDPVSAKSIDATIAQWAASPVEHPRKAIEFVTHTLRYHQADWLSVTGLAEHWNAGRVKANILSDEMMEIRTEGVSQIALDFRQSGWPEGSDEIKLIIDRERLIIEDEDEAAGLQCRLIRDNPDDGQWYQLSGEQTELRKRPGMQGPIDDAFCDRFIFVVPSRPAVHGVVQRWIDREIAYAKSRWQRLMRGDVRIVTDAELTEEQIETCNLICFGDFSSNQFLRDIAPQLPIQWTRDEIRVGDRQFDPSTHAPVFCYPNPRNPDRYVVVNSGMTFREFSNTSNSRQIAMLPDWAVLEVSDEMDDAIFAGNVIDKGFFDERWQLPVAPNN